MSPRCQVSLVRNVDLTAGLHLCKITLYYRNDLISFSAQIRIDHLYPCPLTLAEIKEVCRQNLKETVVVDGAVYTTLNINQKKGMSMKHTPEQYILNVVEGLLCSSTS